MKQNWIFTIAMLLLLGPASLLAQHQVSGTITGDGETLIGVNVLVANTTVGTISDFDGSYRIEAPSADDTLEVSYIGYQTARIPIAGRSQIDIELLPASELLEEIVVVGYGVQRKDDLTGAVAVVESEEIVAIPTQSLGQALQGKVSGLQVTATSGEPGADAIFRVRGTGTFRDANPLFVVDGMIVNDISFINPQDVENVSVLKDASATAIYGARGANGVIIVTTKKGDGSKEGVVQINSYVGVQEVIRKIELTNATEYATLVNELSVNEGRQPVYPDPTVFGEGTDWQDVIFQTANTQNHQISFLGGSETSSYNVSANFYQQEGIIRGSDFQRVSLRLNNEYQIKPFLKLGNNVGIVYSDRELGPGVLLSALRSAPNVPVVDSTGAFGNVGDVSSTANVDASIFYNDNNEQNYRAVGNVYMDIDFLENFTFRSNLGLDYSITEGKQFVPLFFVSPIQQNIQNRLTKRNSRNRNWLWENTIAFNKSWDNWRMDAIAGVTMQDNFGEFLNATRQNFIDENEVFHYLDAGEQGTDATSNSVFGDWGLVSYLGRINVTLLDRFLLTVSGRVDGSSRFGDNFRYGFFPSFALGWNLTNEDFMQRQNLFSRMKLRLSWGQTGNDRIGDFDYTSLVELGQNTVFGTNEDINNGATVLQLANPNLRWEETTQIDVGLEVGFLDNKLLAEIDAYNRISSDILYAVPIPGYLGANAPAQNVAEIQNRGIDLQLDWRDNISQKVSYSIGGILSFLDNEVKKVNGEGIDLFGGGVGFGGILGTNSRAGFPIGAFFGYETIGVFQNEAELQQFPSLDNQQPGDLIFRDINGDGEITPDDRTLIGQPAPTVIYGLNLSFDVAGFDFMIDFNGQAGNEIINAKRASRFGLYNFERSFLDRWNGEGTSNTEPRITTAGTNYDFFSTRFVEDGDFLRLRTLQLGYSLPQTILSKLRLSKLRVYFSGTNLQTWQQFSGYMPEIFNSNVFDVGIDRGKYPIPKTYLAGLEISF